MTVSSSTNRDDYAGNGSTTSFAVSFRFLENSHIKATLRDALSTETLQVETTDYTLTGAGGAGGGTLVMIVAPPSGTTLTIQRDVPATQETDYVENDEFPAESHEDALDKLTMLVQQQGEDSTRHIGFTDTVSDATGAAVELSQDATQRADKFLAFDSAGNIVTKTATDLTAFDQDQQDKRFSTMFATVAALTAANPVAVDGVIVNLTVGMVVSIVDYSTGRNSGLLIGSVVAAATGTPDGGSFIDLANGLQWRQNFPISFVSVKMFGAVGDGVTDDTAAIKAAGDFGNKTILTSGTYLIDSIVFASKVDIEVDVTASIKLKTPAVANTIGITLSGVGSHLECYGLFDGNSTSRSLVSITADDCIARLHNSANVTADAGSTTFTSGIEVNSADNAVVLNDGTTYSNTGQANDSVPRTITVQGTSDDYLVERVRQRTGNAGIAIGSATISGHVELVDLELMSDNGIYHLGGICTYGDVIYSGSEEPVVILGGASSVCSIDRLRAKNAGTTAIRLQDAGTVNINVVELEGTTKGLIGTRSGNTQSGRVTIGSVRGDMAPSVFVQFTSGGGLVEYLTINDVDLVYNFDVANGASTGFGDCVGLEGFSFKQWGIKIVDVNGILSGEIFNLTLPTTNLAEKSYWDTLDVIMVAADGVTQATASFRGLNGAQDLIIVTDAIWQGNAGPYILAATSLSSIRNSTNATPSVGTWRAGTDLIIQGATVAPFRTRCTVAGTPGTWVAY